MAFSSQPTVYVIAGPNGAGKSTFAQRYLPRYAVCQEFVNADLIAAGLSPFNPESQSAAAGRLMLQRIDELTSQRKTFGFETTLVDQWVVYDGSDRPAVKIISNENETETIFDDDRFAEINKLTPELLR